MRTISLKPESTKSGSQTLCSLQILRAGAAWIVVYHHYMQGFHDFHYSTEVGHFFSSTGKFGVDVFFAISGFIMFWTLAHKQYSATDFLLRRVLRVVPIYWLMTFVFILVLYNFPTPFSLQTFRWNIANLLQTLTFIPDLNPSRPDSLPILTVGWSLDLEMFFYILLSIMLYAFRKNWLIPCALILQLMPLIYDHDWIYGRILSSKLLYEFSVGILISYLYFHIRRGNIFISPLWSLVLFTLGILSLQYRIGFNHYKVLSVAMFVAAALMLEQQIARLPMLRLIKYLGDISYSTYLVHPLVLVITIYFMERPQSLGREILTLSAYTLIIFTMSHLSYKWIETGPIMNSLKYKLLGS